MSIKKKCSNAMCSQMIPRSFQPPYCEEHQVVKQPEYNRTYDKTRDLKYKRFYSSSRWQRFRLTVLNEYHWLCQLQYKGCNVTGDTVHHVIEVKQDWNRRFDRDAVTVVCRSCHAVEHDVSP